MKPGAIFVDVDGTLTDAGGSAGGQPREDVIRAVKADVAQGREVVIWSARGSKYARQFCRDAGITGVVCVPKPNVFVDDYVERHGKGFRDDWRMDWLTPEAYVTAER